MLGQAPALAPAPIDVLAHRQGAEAERIATDQRAGMVGQARDDRLDCAVTSIGDRVGSCHRQQPEDAEHEQWGKHPDGEEVTWPHSQGRRAADEDEDHVEEPADLAVDDEFEEDSGQRHRNPEGGNEPPGLGAFFPDGARSGHPSMLGPQGLGPAHLVAGVGDRASAGCD